MTSSPIRQRPFQLTAPARPTTHSTEPITPGPAAIGPATTEPTTIEPVTGLATDRMTDPLNTGPNGDRIDIAKPIITDHESPLATDHH
jgi:hypothetical protein